MKTLNREVGRNGEDIAKKFLLDKGYKILEQNFHTKFGEIDLIAVNGKKIIFIEVKLKIGDLFGSPEEMINLHKLHQIENTSVSYLQKYPEIDKLYPQKQIDAICIVLDGNSEIKTLNHYENITF